MNVTVPASLAGERLDRAVAMLAGVSRSDAASLVAAGDVLIGGVVVTARSRRLAEGEALDIGAVPEAAGSPAPDPGVVFSVAESDAAVIVVDKPAGLVVHPGSGTPGGTLVNGLLARFPDLAGADWPDPERPGIVHRLDKGTSGLLVVARTPAALADLSAQLRARTIERGYVCAVRGLVEADAGTIDAPLGRSVRDPVRISVRADGRRAVTHYEVLERFSGAAASLLACRLETGRTHQIRAHLAAIGHPVLGDARYGGGGGPGSLGGRPFLHAARLAFDHPVDRGRRAFRSPLPADLDTAVAALRSRT